MADKWMDERDREMRDRDGRRSEQYGRGGGGRGSSDEGRSWDDGDEGRGYGAQRSGPGRDRVFGERETGMGYGGEGRYGRFEGGYGQEGRGGGGRGGDRENTAWQGRDYGGVSPAMEQGEYEAERGAERYQQGRGGRDASGGYDQGGRFYGDDRRERIYRQEYGQGGVEYGRVPRGYDAEDERRRGDVQKGYDRRPFSGGDMASGGTGGYDYERGYGDAGRRGVRGDRGQSGVERGGYEAGDFLRRAGERVASWFGAGDGGRDEAGARERDRGFRGMGPKDYQRPDERISEEVHERLTDDPWLDASQISASVSGGEVTLSGTVENREAKHRAERIVEDLSGVKHVQNNLRLAEGNFFTSPSRGYGDSVLQQQMREAETGEGASNETAQARSGRSRGGTLSS